MTPYKALATYLQSSTVQNQFDSAFEFYPIQAPQGQSPVSYTHLTLPTNREV